MKKIFHIKQPVLVVGLFTAVVGVISLLGGSNAYAATRTWTGAGDGSTFSSTANWSGGAVPVTGDTIVLPAISANAVSITNDSSASFAGLALQSSTVATSGATSYTIDTISFQNNATITRTVTSGQKQAALSTTSQVIGVGNLNVSGSAINGVFTVAGNVTVGVAGGTPGRIIPSNGSDITGDVIINSNSLHYTSNYGAPARYVLNAGGELIIEPSDPSVTTPIVFNGPRAILNVSNSHDCDGNPLSYFDPCSTAVNHVIPAVITLNNDALVFAPGGVTVNFTGTITANGHRIIPVKIHDGSVRVNGAPVVPSASVSLLSSTNVTELFVGQNETFTIDGTSSGRITAFDGATITGVGRINFLVITRNATLIPGNSPGTITVSTAFAGWGTLQLELQNTNTYDRLIVGQDYTGSNNTVELSGDLELRLYDGWGFRQGDKITIIDNRHSSAVSGTFSGLPEGSEITVGDMRFSISYVGGNGNDVELTALTTGGILPPNTGVASLMMANPVLPISLGITTAILLGIVLVRRRARS